MKIIVDLINKSLKILENEKNIYVGNNNADVLEVYCYNGGYHLENEFVSITGLLSNGRKIGPFTTDSAYDEEYIDGKLHTLAKFTLTKQNGFTLSEGQLNITVWYNKTNDSGAIVSKQAIGNLLFNVVKTANVDDNIIITDASGDVIYNFKLEIENIQSAVNSVNNGLLLKADKNDIPTKVSQLENDTDYVDSERLTDVVDDLEAQIQRGGRTYFYSYDLTINNTVKELISKLKSYDKFDENNKGKFYIELSDGTVLEYISIEISSSRYYINSIIYKRTSIEVFQGQLPTTTTKTIEQLINEHKAITTKDYVDEKVANLVNSAPSTLDTLKELSTALGNAPNFATTVAEQIGKKANKDDVPTKTSDLTNDNKFTNETYVKEEIAKAQLGGETAAKVYLKKSGGTLTGDLD